MTAYDVATFGEGQLRLTVPRGERLRSARSLSMVSAGSEANVAALLAQLGHRTAWASVLPAGDLGDRILSEYRAAGVDLDHVVRPASGRVAIYFLEPGAGAKPANVTYDREHTPFRDIDLDVFDWARLLDTRILFVTGITAVLTQRTTDLVGHAVRAAAERGVTVALDVNYRSKLANPEVAADVMRTLLDHVNLLMCSRSDAETLFGITGAGQEVADELRAMSSADEVVSTDGIRGVSYSGGDGSHAYEVSPTAVLDRPGAGDAFIGGVLHGYLGGDIRAGIEGGLRAASIALTHDGDLTQISNADLETPSGFDILR